MAQHKCLDTYCSVRDGYRVKAFKPQKWAYCTGPWAANIYIYRANKPQSVNVNFTGSKIIYDKHLNGRNLTKMETFPMDDECKLCGGANSQHHIVCDCAHKDMMACR